MGNGNFRMSQYYTGHNDTHVTQNRSTNYFPTYPRGAVLSVVIGVRDVVLLCAVEQLGLDDADWLAGEVVGGVADKRHEQDHGTVPKKVGHYKLEILIYLHSDMLSQAHS
jgi:predicted Zn-dependent protease with MMP-like domain